MVVSSNEIREELQLWWLTFLGSISLVVLNLILKKSSEKRTTHHFSFPEWDYLLVHTKTCLYISNSLDKLLWSLLWHIWNPWRGRQSCDLLEVFIEFLLEGAEIIRHLKMEFVTSCFHTKMFSNKKLSLMWLANHHKAIWVPYTRAPQLSRSKKLMFYQTTAVTTVINSFIDTHTQSYSI